MASKVLMLFLHVSKSKVLPFTSDALNVPIVFIRGENVFDSKLAIEMCRRHGDRTLHKRSRKERGNKLIAGWVQKIQCLKICVQSEARTQMGS